MGNMPQLILSCSSYVGKRSFGMIFMLVGLIYLPIFLLDPRLPDPMFYACIYLLSMFTMFHAAMRLALPGVVFGAAFMRIVTLDKLLRASINDQILIISR